MFEALGIMVGSALLVDRRWSGLAGDRSSRQALPDSQFSVGSADVDDAESGGFWSWLKKQGNTLAKGIGAGVIGAGMVVAGALLLGAGAPLILAGAEFALLGGAIYGATVDPGSFNWTHAISVSVFSGAGAAVGAGSWLPAVGRTASCVAEAGRAATGLQGLFGVGRGIASSAP